MYSVNSGLEMALYQRLSRSQNKKASVNGREHCEHHVLSCFERWFSEVLTAGNVNNCQRPYIELMSSFDKFSMPIFLTAQHSFDTDQASGRAVSRFYPEKYRAS